MNVLLSSIINFEHYILAHQSHLEGDMPARRRDSSIKKILSNQSLEKQEYDGKIS